MSWIALLLVVGLTLGFGCCCCRACRPHDGELRFQATVAGLAPIRCEGCGVLSSTPFTLYANDPARLESHCDWPTSDGLACLWSGGSAAPCDPVDCDACTCDYQCMGSCASNDDCFASCNAEAGGCEDCRFLHSCNVEVDAALWLQTCVCDNPPEGTCLCEPCSEWLSIACDDGVDVFASLSIYRAAGSESVVVAATVQTSWIDGSIGLAIGSVEIEAAQLDCGDLDVTIPLADDCELPWTAGPVMFRCAAPASLRVQSV